MSEDAYTEARCATAVKQGVALGALADDARASHARTRAERRARQEARGSPR